MSDLVVVPTPLRKSRLERRLCDAQSGVLLGPRVATLRNLAPGLLAAAGERRALLDPLGERLLALGAARDSGLVDPRARPHGGASRAAARLLAEARSGEVRSGDLREAAATVRGQVADRLETAARAMALYEERLDGLGALDSAAALRAAAEAAARGASSEETRDLGLLLLEGLLPSSRAALDLGAALALRARRVLARVPFLPEEPRRSAAAEPWLRRIESLHEAAARRDLRVEFPSSGAITRDRVIRLPAPDDAGQCDAAARLAGELLDQGIPPSDVAVVAPGRLLDLLPAAFGRLGVPLSAPGSAPLAAHPVYQDVRAALRGAGALDRTVLEALLGSPWLSPAGAPAEPRLLLDRAGVLDGRGDAEARLRERAARLSAGRAAAERAGLLRLAAAVADLRERIAPLGTPATPAGWAGRVRALLERAGARRRAARGDPALARRDLAAIARLEDLLDELSAALAATGEGARRLPREEFAGLLDLAAGLASLPAGGGPASQAVEAWPVEESPGLSARAVLVLGAERGSWPGTPIVDSLLGNAAREAVDAHLRRPALATAYHLRSEAELRGWSALAAGREVLAVAWAAGPDRAGPAPLAAQALDLAGAEERLLARDPPLESARGAAEALRAAARLAEAGQGDLAARALEGMPDLARRAAGAAARGRVERERRDAWLEGVAVAAAGRIPPGLPALAASLPDQWSATDLETFAGCAYRFLLRASGLPDAGGGGLDMEPRDEGALLHAILEGFVRRRRDRGAWPLSGGDADREEAREVAREQFDRFEADGRVGDPATWAGRREAVLATVDRFVDAEAAAADGMRPALLEHGFGGRTGTPPLAIPSAGGEVLLQGRIDRVDDDGTRLRVVDYKNSRSVERARDRLSAEALGVTSFQIPVYLLAAARELPGRSELSATFSLLRSGERVGPWTVPPGDPFLELDPDRRAAIRASGGHTLADGVVEAVARIRAGDFPVASLDCTGCPFGAVCRFPRPGEA